MLLVAVCLRLQKDIAFQDHLLMSVLFVVAEALKWFVQFGGIQLTSSYLDWRLIRDQAELGQLLLSVLNPEALVKGRLDWI